MNLSDIASWHRIQQEALKEGARNARIGFAMGREDAQFDALRLDEHASKHAEMAALLEQFAPVSQLPVR